MISCSSQKKAISILLVPVLLILASLSFYDWVNSLSNGNQANIDFLFFVDFFTILILVDVLLLLI